LLAQTQVQIVENVTICYNAAYLSLKESSENFKVALEVLNHGFGLVYYAMEDPKMVAAYQEHEKAKSMSTTSDDRPGGSTSYMSHASLFTSKDNIKWRELYHSLNERKETSCEYKDTSFKSQ
jgi:hypothetical protein